jgi:superfamily II DNA or RNA helicase
MKYTDFIAQKLKANILSGFTISHDQLNSIMLPHQKDLVAIALKTGRYCIWADTGLGKALMGLEWSRHVCDRTNKPVLIVAPLGVAHQIVEVEAVKFGYEAKFIESDSDVFQGINVTNYEKLDRFDLSVFSGVVLDESSCLKSYQGKVRNFIIESFANTPYKLACSATPAPNDHTELGNQCEFVGALTMDEMLAEYFVHDGGSTQDWRLKKHAQDKFWQFVSSWAAYISNPAQLGYDGDAYVLPPIEYKEYIVGEWSDLTREGELLKHQATGLSEQREIRKLSINERCQKVLEIINQNPDESWLVWCETNDESALISKMVTGIVEVKGADPENHKKDSLIGFSKGEIKRLISKAKIAGFGMNFQICHNVIYVGLTHSHEQFYQSVRRVYRFGQTNTVNVHIIQHVLDGAIISNLQKKEKAAKELADSLTKKLMLGVAREQKDYCPTVTMKLPKWVQSVDVDEIAA